MLHEHTFDYQGEIRGGDLEGAAGSVPTSGAPRGLVLADHAATQRPRERFDGTNPSHSPVLAGKAPARRRGRPGVAIGAIGIDEKTNVSPTLLGERPEEITPAVVRTRTSVWSIDGEARRSPARRRRRGAARPVAWRLPARLTLLRRWAAYDRAYVCGSVGVSGAPERLANLRAAATTLASAVRMGEETG